MQKRILQPIAITLFLSSLFFSCSKQRTEEPELNQYSHPQKFMYDNRPEEQTFILTGDSAGPIIGNQGTHLWMDSTIFMFQDGSDVPYPIVIKLIELYTPKDIMLYEMPTVGQSIPLGNDGEIRVRALKDGVELLLKPNKVFPVRMPADSPNPLMSLWYGKPVDTITDWYDLPSAVSGNAGIDALELVQALPDSGYYNALSPVLGWLGMDFLYGWNSGNVTVNLASSTDDLTGVVKYIYIPAVSSVVQLYSNTSITLPAGVPMKLVCFAQNQAGAMYSFMQDLNLSAGSTTVEVTMSAISDDALIDALENL